MSSNGDEITTISKKRKLPKVTTTTTSPPPNGDTTDTDNTAPIDSKTDIGNGSETDVESEQKVQKENTGYTTATTIPTIEASDTKNKTENNENNENTDNDNNYDNGYNYDTGDGNKTSTTKPTTSTTATLATAIPAPKPTQTNTLHQNLIRKDNPYSKIRHCIVQNDNTHQNLVRLIGLKSLFAKQLPKMPKEYIVRLLFDRRHKSLAILSEDPQYKDATTGLSCCDDEIIGGICYRPYPEMRFAEIAFCAVNGSHQVKGYGTKLMNLLKGHAVLEGIEYFITYADKYAIGYFRKQGFTKTITMPKSRFHGLIKDYDGATIMECYIHPSIDFTRIPEMISAQRQFILDRVRVVSKSDKVVYPSLAPSLSIKAPSNTNDVSAGCGGSSTTKKRKIQDGTDDGTSDNFDDADNDDDDGTPTNDTSTGLILPTATMSRGNESANKAMAIPGVVEAGWTLPDLLAATTVAKDTDKQKNHIKSELLSLLSKTEEQQCAWPFREPVNTTEVKDYLDIVKDPIDLSTIDKRIRKGDWYKSKKMLYVDLKRMVENCKLFNDSDSTYYECAVLLDTFLNTIFVDVL